MNKKDLIILSCLREDARQRITTLSRKTQIPISTIFDRISLQCGGIIKKYTVLIDFAKIDFNARANIVIKVEREQREELQKYLMKNHNVNSLAKTNNGFDFFVECVFRHIKGVEDFIENLEDNFKITSKQTYYIIEDLKKEGFLSSPNSIKLIEK